MLNQTIEARSPLPKGSISWLIVCIACGVSAYLTNNYHFLLAGVMPLALTFLFWTNQPRAVNATLNSMGMVLLDTQQTVPYESIKHVILGDQPISLSNTTFNNDLKRSEQLPITVVHELGHVYLPRLMNVCAVELTQFLANQAPVPPVAVVPECLADYAEEQKMKFGENKVTCIHQRAPAHRLNTSGLLKQFGQALVFSGLSWIVVASAILVNKLEAEAFQNWQILGLLSLVIGILCWALGRTKSQHQQIDVSKHGNSCIVVGPLGLGLLQGDLQGKLRWDEINGVKNVPARTIGGNGAPSLRLSFSGGEIGILDIYDRSLVDITSLITLHTQGPLS